MLSFREEFYDTANTIFDATNDPLLQDVLPIGSNHNTRARVLRLGLAVSTFSTLENYITNVFAKLVYSASLSSIAFDFLPDSARRFILVDALVGAVTRMSFIRGLPDKILFADQHLTTMSGLRTTPRAYSSLGFSPKGSNVGHDDVKDALAAFGVRDPWREMGVIAGKIGLGSVDLRSDFIALSRSRHAAAHQSTSNIPTSTLQSLVRSALVIGMSCDILAGNTAEAIRTCTRPAALVATVQRFARPIRFLDPQSDGSWLETAEGRRRASQRHQSKSAGIGVALARRGMPFVVIRDTQRLPTALVA